MIEIMDRTKMRFECRFCGKQFKTCSECAKHIEGESITKLCFPEDILIVEVK